MLICQTASGKQIISLFVHGIADSGKQALSFTKSGDRPYVIEGHLATFDFQCCTPHWWRIHIPACSLGQENELEQLNHQWQKLNQEFPKADGFILIGVSRGASAIINFVATYQAEKIKALILESPFDSIDTIIEHKSKQLSVPQCIVENVIKSIFWKFRPDGICPKKIIDKIDKDIPMLFITVEDDHMVPKICSENLFNARKNQGHKNCYHLHLMNGKHGKIILGPDGDTYQAVAHAFLAQYALPHNLLYAKQGMQHLNANK